MKQIIITESEENGRTIYQVPLSNTDQEATIYKEDWQALMSIGVSNCWALHPKGYISVAAYRAHGGNILVGRAMLDAGPGEIVKYKDGNKLN